MSSAQIIGACIFLWILTTPLYMYVAFAVGRYTTVKDPVVEALSE